MKNCALPSAALPHFLHRCYFGCKGGFHVPQKIQKSSPISCIKVRSLVGSASRILRFMGERGDASVMSWGMCISEIRERCVWLVMACWDDAHKYRQKLSEWITPLLWPMLWVTGTQGGGGGACAKGVNYCCGAHRYSLDTENLVGSRVAPTSMTSCIARGEIRDCVDACGVAAPLY